MDIARTFINIFCQVLSLAIIARAILSWVAPNPYNQPMRFLNEITEPILAPLRRIVPRLGMIDITPMIAVVILQLMAWLVIAAG